MARNAQILPLTGIRFFLALWVALFHQTAPSRTLTDVIPHWPGPLFCFMRTGYVAVGVFFLLSGFVLSYSYPLRERWSAYRIVQFAIARFARIYPAYLLGLLLIAPLVAAHFFATNKIPRRKWLPPPSIALCCSPGFPAPQRPGILRDGPSLSKRSYIAGFPSRVWPSGA
jgi:peptidoglycan/LPS O-acetylase OafA/YrhL